MTDVVVIGAGVGGLSAAISLAAAGRGVVVAEASDRPGGKLGLAQVDGVEFDTGPSVLTLPGVIQDLMRRAGTRLEDELTLVEPAPAFRYLYPDGAVVDVHPAWEDTLASVERSLGPRAAAELARFGRYSRRIWTEAAPAFVFGPAPSTASLAARGGRSLLALARIDPMRTMWSAIRRRVRSEHLRVLLARYATYNGSDPRRAPATLNCISHVELALGGFGVQGGMYELARALVRVAERLKVQFRFGTRVTGIEVGAAGVTGVRLEDGTRLGARAVVGNAEADLVLNQLLPPGYRPRPARKRAARSMSGWVGVARARRASPGRERVAHTVAFPREYMQEFEDIFGRERAPRDPTVYACAQEVAHGRTGWAEHEPLFLMANAPAVGARRGTSDWPGLRAAVLDRARRAGILNEEDELVYERTPADLAEQFPGSGGSLYGAASNSPWSAFRRPANRVGGVPGLYLASGSAHPGGGVPLCLLSGMAAAAAMLGDGR